MADLLHRIMIDASPADVFRALTTHGSLARWWTADVEAEPVEGSIAIFGFNRRAVVFRMQVERLVTDREVRWRCLGDFDEWTGTMLDWRIAPAERTGVTVSLAHRGWRSIEGYYAQCNTDWGRLMYYLKDEVEGRGSGPMMR
jgi:uncharacterized protein YndB with AHSA1/START domain